MATRKLLLATLCLTAAASLAPAVSSAGVNVDIDVAPPAPRVEVVPAARPGWVWAPGYWAWRGREHVWVGGRWVHERRGYHWVPDAWVARGPHYHYVRGHWER
ncbi:MAG TPA: YXWGXW repeat-containing protein [Steroidobacteraceae bacterium]|jgi:hypothetical protein